MKDQAYPRKVRVTKRQLQEFLWSEEHLDDMVEILKRHKTVIEFRNKDEVAKIWWSLCCGTMQVLDECYVQQNCCTHKLALRLADRLKETVKELAPEYAAAYPYPTGK
jgi:hypothetical protein